MFCSLLKNLYLGLGRNQRTGVQALHAKAPDLIPSSTTLPDVVPNQRKRRQKQTMSELNLKDQFDFKLYYLRVDI